MRFLQLFSILALMLVPAMAVDAQTQTGQGGPRSQGVGHDYIWLRRWF